MPERQGGEGAGSAGNGAGAGEDPPTIDEVGLELAGIVGIHPWDATLRELWTMAMARQRAEWDRTASILAMISGALGGEADISRYHPYMERVRKMIPFEALRRAKWG